MTDCASDIMVRDFDSIDENALAAEAISKIFSGKLRRTGYKTVSLMVTDEMHQLVGVITMFDILYHLRPTFLNYGVDGYAVSWEKLMEPAINELKDKHVRQIMSRDVVTADPDDHVMAVLDRMVKHKYRRLPVVKNGRLVGVVYIADVFYHLFNR